MSPESFLMHSYASIFFKCQNVCVFWSNFPAKIIQNHKIISFETFWKSLTRLSRLLKVLSWPRLSRLANASTNLPISNPTTRNQQSWILISISRILGISLHSCESWHNWLGVVWELVRKIPPSLNGMAEQFLGMWLRFVE